MIKNMQIATLWISHLNKAIINLQCKHQVCEILNFIHKGVLPPRSHQAFVHRWSDQLWLWRFSLTLYDISLTALSIVVAT